MSGIRFKRDESAFHDAPSDTADVAEAVEELEILEPDLAPELEVDESTQAERLELRVRGDLETRGIVGAEAARLAVVLSARLLERGPDAYEDLIAGAQMVHQVRTDLAADLADSHRELRQLERLMGGFAIELRKLDEVLEVLAAYVRRMRGSASENGRQTLH